MPTLLFAVVVFVVYGRILNHEFLLNWDDNKYITENQAIQGFSWDNICTVFTSYYVGNYAPLQMLSYMFDYQTWGLWPGGYLLHNMVLHIFNGILFYHLLLKLHDQKITALAGALVFLLHPVQVESVVWISQRKNLLAMFFFLLSWESYRLYRSNAIIRKRTVYILSVAAFLMALLTKSVTVILPVVLVLYENFFETGRGGVRIKDKIPYLLSAAVIAFVAYQSQSPDFSSWGAGGGRALQYHGGSPVATFFTMLTVFLRYLQFLVWPKGLSAEYDPQIHDSLDPAVVVAAMLIAAIVLLAYKMYCYDKKLGFWAMVFVVGLIPVAQIVPLVTLINDRYLYFPMLGIGALVGVGVNVVKEKIGILPAGLLIVSVVATLGVVSFQRAGVWKNGVTLWRDAVGKSPDKSVTWQRYGEACQKAPLLQDEALRAYRRALGLNPTSTITIYNMGILFFEKGDYAESVAILNRMLKDNPENVMGWTALGNAQVMMKNYQQAEHSFQRAHKLQPDAMQPLFYLGDLTYKLGEMEKSRGYYAKAEAMAGDDPGIAFQLACVEAATGNIAKSLQWLEVAFQRGFNDYQLVCSSEKLTKLHSEAGFHYLLTRYFPGHHAQ